MNILKLRNEYENSIGAALLAGVMAVSVQHALYMSMPRIQREIKQKRFEEGRYLRDSSSIKRCNEVIEYYEDVFGTFEWAH